MSDEAKYQMALEAAKDPGVQKFAGGSLLLIILVIIFILVFVFGIFVSSIKWSENETDELAKCCDDPGECTC